MKVQLLPSSFNENGCASPGQHLSCFVIDDCVAIDAGSLAMAATLEQKLQIRDVVLTHAHLDHIAGLPLYVDDLFASLTEPVRVHASEPVIEILERDVFNWDVYPRFSELANENGAVLKYFPIYAGRDFRVRHLRFKGVEVNHKVPSLGFVIADAKTRIAITGDTAAPDAFWREVNNQEKLDALLIECAFPDELSELAETSHHLTPRLLENELERMSDKTCPVFVINLKPMYRERIILQLDALKIKNLNIFEVGEIYEF